MLIGKSLSLSIFKIAFNISDKMIRLPGKRENSARYFLNGHVYYWDNRHGGYTMRCSQKNPRGCTAIAIINSIEDLSTVYTHGVHLEDPDHLLLLREKFDEEVINSAKTDQKTDLKILFDTVRNKNE